MENFNLICQHLNYADLITLSEVSKVLNNLIGTSEICIQKIRLKLDKPDASKYRSELGCFATSTRKYRNVLIDCRNDSRASEDFVKILKQFERSIIDLDVRNTAYKRDRCGTLKFADRPIVLAKLKHLKLQTSNDHLTEVLFISSTCLVHLELKDVPLNKYFHYCLMANENLTFLKIEQPPTTISYDKKGLYDHFSFKLDRFEFLNQEKENADYAHSELLRKLIMPLVVSQFKHLKSLVLKNVAYTDFLNILESQNIIKPTNLRISLVGEALSYKAENLEMVCAYFNLGRHFDKKLIQFLKRSGQKLKNLTLSGIESCAVAEFVMKEMMGLETLTMGTEDYAWIPSEAAAVTRIETTSTDAMELQELICMGTRAKTLRIFNLDTDVMSIMYMEQNRLENLEYHFVHPACIGTEKTLKRVEYLDPILRLPEEVLELVFQHLEAPEVEELTRTWTKFYFQESNEPTEADIFAQMIRMRFNINA